MNEVDQNLKINDDYDTMSREELENRILSLLFQLDEAKRKELIRKYISVYGGEHFV